MPISTSNHNISGIIGTPIPLIVWFKNNFNGIGIQILPKHPSNQGPVTKLFHKIKGIGVPIMPKILWLQVQTAISKYWLKTLALP